MTEHSCNDGCQGSYQPARKIVVPKTKLPLILTDRLLQRVAIKGILELGSLLYKHNELFFTLDNSLPEKFTTLLRDYPLVKVNLLAPINDAKTEFALFNYTKGKVTVMNNYELNTDIAPSFKDHAFFNNFCEELKANTLSFIPVPLTGMLTLKSIKGVLPYDFLLAKHYLKQYLDAYNALNEEDLDLLNRIKEEGLPTIDDNYNDKVKLALRIERKLYLQYNSH